MVVLTTTTKTTTDSKGIPKTKEITLGSTGDAYYVMYVIIKPELELDGVTEVLRRHVIFEKPYGSLKIAKRWYTNYIKQYITHKSK